MGYWYRPRLKSGAPCSIWWIQYYIHGRRVKESSHSRKESDARTLLREREGRVARGERVVPRLDRVTYKEAAADLRQHYVATGRRDLDEYDRRVQHLTRFFADHRLASIKQVAVNRYITARQAEGRKPA